MSIEIFNEPESPRKWLWECDCGEQRTDYRSWHAAERDAHEHSCPDSPVAADLLGGVS